MTNNNLKDYVRTLKDTLEKNDFLALDSVLEFIVSWNLTGKEIEKIDDILSEATLYMELKEDEYKNEALRLISEFK